MGLFLITGALSEVWGTVSILQLLSFVNFMNLYMPANSKAFLDFLAELSEFQFFSYDEIYKTSFGDIYVIDQQYRFGRQEDGQVANELTGERRLDSD